MTEDLVRDLRSRLEALSERADSGPLLDDQAAQHARALRHRYPLAKQGSNSPETIEILRILALVHWNRHCLSADENGEDLAAAAELFSHLHRHDPLMVPDPLLPLITLPSDADDEGGCDYVTWDGMAAEFLAQYESTGELNALRTAVQLLAVELDSTPDTSPQRVPIFLQLTATLLRHYAASGDEAVLDALLETARAETTTAPSRSVGLVWSSVSAALRARAERRGDNAMLQDAIHSARQAVGLTAHDSPHYAIVLTRLAAALTAQWRRTGNIAALDEAADLMRDAVSITNDSEPEQADRSHNLSVVLLELAQRTGNPDILSEALQYGLRAAALVVEGDAYRADVLGNLAAILLERFHRTNNLEELGEAVALLRSSLDSLPASHMDFPSAVAQLGGALLLLSQHSGDSESLAHAVDAFRAAVGATPVGHPDRSRYMSNLGAALRTRFVRTGDGAYLDEAIEVLRHAVSALPEDHPERATQLNNLGNALRTRYERFGSPADLERAVDAIRAAVGATPVGHPDRSRYMSNLGAALRILYARSGDGADLDEAIEVLRHAVWALPEDHPERATRLNNLGNALRTRYERTHSDQDRDAAACALLAASASPTAPPLLRVRSAWAYGNAALRDGEPDRALDGFKTAIHLLPLIAPRALTHDDREYRLSQLNGLASDAAAAALEADEPALAVELLEQARGTLLGDLLVAHSEMDDLARADPASHAEVLRLRDALSSADTDPGRRLALANEFDKAVSRIRSLPGFEHFLRPPAITEIQAQAYDGPIVFVNVSEHRSDVLIVTSDPGQSVRVVRLPDLTPSILNAETRQLHHSIAASTMSSARTRLEAQQSISRSLAWLWDTIVEPTLKALGHTGPPKEGQPWPRLWWCPVGATARLPLHAAGRHDEAGASQTATSALDRVISTYTPTVRALSHARRRASQQTKEPDTHDSGPLVIAVPDVPGAPPLPYALAEERALSSMMPDATTLVGPEATRESVLRALTRHPVAHIACHAVVDQRNPTANRLLLADAELSAKDLLTLRLDRTELAVLSACSTATTGPARDDEAIHLTSTFLAAGARQVVGTLWPAIDNVAQLAAQMLYEQLTDRGAHAPQTELTAQALHQTTRTLREQYPREPGFWALLVHVGA